MKVTNFNGAKNQFIIKGLAEGMNCPTLIDCIQFQSYSSVIVRQYYYKDGSIKTYLDCNKWDYSKTTGKYRNLFLNETKKETEKKIASGEYVLTNLNN